MPSPLVPDKIEDELEMTMVCHRPEGLEQLEAQTNFTKRELQVLYRGFKNVRPAQPWRPRQDFPLGAKLSRMHRGPLWEILHVGSCKRKADSIKETGEQGHLARKKDAKQERGGLSRWETGRPPGIFTGWHSLGEFTRAQILSLA